MQSLPFFIAWWTQFIFWRKLFFFSEGCSNLGLFHQQCKQNQDHNSLLQYGILWLTPNWPIIFLYELQVREFYACLRNFSENHDLSQMLNLLPILHWTSLLFHIKWVEKFCCPWEHFLKKPCVDSTINLFISAHFSRWTTIFAIKNRVKLQNRFWIFLYVWNLRCFNLVFIC